MLLAGAMCVGAMAGCGSTGGSSASGQSGGAAASSGKKLSGKIAFIISNKDEYQSALDQGVKAAGMAKGIEVTSVDCASDMDRQIDQVKAEVANGAAALIVLVADDTRADEIIEAAGDTPVVFVNRIPQDTKLIDEKHPYVGSNEDESGVFQGEMLAEALKKEKKDSVNYLMLQGTAGLLHTTKRSEGVLKALKDAGITATEVVPAIDCGFDRTTAMNKILELKANGTDLSKIDCLLCNNDAMALGGIEGLRQCDVDISKVKVVGVDGTGAGLQAITDGTMTATVFQNAVGQASASLQAAINLATGEKLTKDISYDTDKNNKGIIWIPFEKVTPDNVSDYF